MAKFCGKCGAGLDEDTGLCPNCDAEKIKKQATLRKKEAKKKHKAAKMFLKLLMWFMFIVLIVCCVLGILTYYGIIKAPYINNVFQKIGITSDMADRNSGEDSYTVTPPDAEDYYSNNSQIVSEIDAKGSEKVNTEEEACTILESRNFVDYPITTEYSMDGDYSDTVDISKTSSEKHPIYQTYYRSENGELWTIFLINGAVMANPVSYNLQSGMVVQVIVSESNTVTSYDSTTNRFYETIPSAGALVVITIGKIDSESLDSLTIGEIERHV